jgi:hypothetical protein
MSLSAWEVEANKCRETLAKSIPEQFKAPEDALPGAEELHVANFCKTSGLFSEKELAITESTATKLVEQMGKGELTAEEVVVAFLKRATVGQQLLNFATEFMAEEAIARAKELDAYYKETGKLVGPLASGRIY